MKNQMALMEVFNEELTKAGVMKDCDDLRPSREGKRVRFDGKSRTVVDGPFTGDLVVGYRLWEQARHCCGQFAACSTRQRRSPAGGDARAPRFATSRTAERPREPARNSCSPCEGLKRRRSGGDTRPSHEVSARCGLSSAHISS